MPEGTVQEALPGNAVKTEPVKERIYCHKCGSDRVRRVYREGYLQQRVYPLFGYFPWRCLTCGARVMLRKRHRARIHR